MRKLPLIVATAGLALVLAGCAGNPTDGSTASPTAAPAAAVGSCVDTPSGSVSDGVKVTGDIGSKAEAKFDTPVKIDSTQRTIVTKGDGETAKVGDLLPVNFTLFNGTSGDEVFSTYDEGQSSITLTVDQAVNLPGLVKAVECAPAGSRVVAVVPAADAFGDTGNPQLKIEAGDNLVFVLDMGEITPDKATGADQPATPGFPTVSLADDGTPTVVIPDNDPPADLQIAVLKKGDGKTVAAGDAVTVQYQGTVWSSKTIFDQSWGKTPATFTTDKVIPGFSKALVGQTVGSQVIVVIPPAEGYGDAGQPSAGIAGTDTLVFVVDILSIG
jgi:FKBP-type peptidyl-prolyl cis-trans isomerase